jgi:quinol monooxygenase YgiN
MATQIDNAIKTPTLQLYLLSIRGTLAPTSLEAARAIHNQTAGHPQSIAAAQSLGDLSHMVYVPTEQQGDTSGEFMILDIWNSMEGLNAFFASPQVQEQAGLIFRSRAPFVWTPASGFSSCHFPVPHGRNDRYVGVVHGPVSSRAAAQEQHNTIIAGQLTAARRRGMVSHEAFFQLTPPDAPQSLEFFAVDVWSSEAGMREHYDDPSVPRAFDGFFTAAPSATTWQHPTGEWAEW